MGSLRARLQSTGRRGEAPSSALATPLLHIPVSSQETRGTFSATTAGELRHGAAFPILGACSAYPATNTILEI